LTGASLELLALRSTLLLLAMAVYVYRGLMVLLVHQLAKSQSGGQVRNALRNRRQLKASAPP
jgi:hypothetical protein